MYRREYRCLSASLKRLWGVLALCIGQFVLGGQLTLAAEPTDAQSTQQPSTVEEVIVTAQRREQRLQEVPMSVTALAGDALEAQAARDIKDVLLNVPGLSYSGVEPGQSRYAIRGISTAAANPTVGVYMNDVSLVTLSTAFSGAADPVFLDMDRVEVLKGPQGTLYGGNAMGGAIKYVTRSPKLDQVTIDAEGGVATVHGGGVSYELESALNMPVVADSFAVRLSGLHRFDAGYVDQVPNADTQDWTRSATLPPAPFSPLTYSSLSTFAQKDANTRSTSAGRLAAKWRVDDSLVVEAAATLQRSRKANPDDFFTNLSGFGNSPRFAQPTNDDLDIYDVNIVKDFGALRFSSLTGYLRRRLEWDRDYSLFAGSLVPGLLDSDTFNSSNTSTRTISQEFHLGSAPSVGSPWTWLVGAFYSHQNDELLQVSRNPDAGTFFGTGTDVTYFGDQFTTTRQVAAFADATYALDSRWSLNAGLRWFEIKQVINATYDGVFNGGFSQVDDKRSTNSGVTPKASVSFQIDPAHLMYVTASKGFRQGGPNQFDTSSPLCAPDFERLGITRIPAAYDADSLWTYEVGSKNQANDGRFLVNGALFYTDWSKIQQTVFLNSCGFNFTGNVGAARVEGAELAAQVVLADPLSLGGSAAYTDSEITRSSPNVQAQPGQPVLDTPKWTGSVYGDYRFLRASSWAGTLHVEYQYHGSNIRKFPQFASVTYPDGSGGLIPDATQLQSAYRVVNARFLVSHNAWDYILYVDNAANARPILDFARDEGVSAATTLRPRTIGINVRTKLGF